MNDLTNSYNLSYTEKTRAWLDNRFKRGKDGYYLAHRPIYGFGVGPSEKNHTIRYAVAYSPLKILNRLEWETVLEVGGGEGYMSWIIREIFNKLSFTSEISIEANIRAREFFGLCGISADVQRLPFKDESFDIVLASEVIEHLQYPHLALYEMARIARKAVIINTNEFYASETERYIKMRTLNYQSPHTERNYWHPNDLKRFFSGEVQVLTSTITFMDIDERAVDEDEAKELVKSMCVLDEYKLDAQDALVFFNKGDCPLGIPKIDEGSILEQLFSLKINLEQLNQEAIPFAEECLCCPACHGDLELLDGKYRCVYCSEDYFIDRGIPVFISKSPLFDPSPELLAKTGVNPDGYTHLKGYFKSFEQKNSKLNRIFFLLALVFCMLIRYILSKVPWKIKIKWLKNKTNLNNFLHHFLK
jgi:SAM-dependent methyltransferase